MKPELEGKYRDRISGFTGKCTGLAQYVGRDEALLTPEVDNPSVLLASNWFDVGRLEPADGTTSPVGFRPGGDPL